MSRSGRRHNTLVALDGPLRGPQVTSKTLDELGGARDVSDGPGGLLFDALTPLGFRVRVTRQSWELMMYQCELARRCA